MSEAICDRCGHEELLHGKDKRCRIIGCPCVGWKHRTGDTKAINELRGKVTSLRTALDAANKRIAELEGQHKGLVLNNKALRDRPDLGDRAKTVDTLLTKGRALKRECEAWHKAEHLRKDEPHNEFVELAEARAATRATKAMEGWE